MSKKIHFSTLSLGSNPDEPNLSDLAGFVQKNTGREVDLNSFYLERSLSSQLNARIEFPCGGGRFLGSRLTEFIGSETGNPDTVTDLIQDAELITRITPHALSALPALSVLKKDCTEELFSSFRTILRKMRDRNVRGHILHADITDELELELLSSPRTIFWLDTEKREEVESLLEYQSILIVRTDMINIVPDLMDNYDIRNFWVIDPDYEAYSKLLEIMDPDKIRVAGFGTGDESRCWIDVVNSSEIEIEIVE